MNYLVDTHVLIWAVANSAMLSSTARSVLSDPTGKFFFSPMSIWEIAIKHTKHPDEMPLDAATAATLFQSAGFLELRPDAEQCAAVESLPSIHADPFDRILIAQAMAKRMSLVTHDHHIPLYGKFVIPV